MLPAQFVKVEAGQRAVLDDPAALHHHPVGFGAAAEHQGRQRIAGAGMAQLLASGGAPAGTSSTMTLSRTTRPPDAAAGPKTASGCLIHSACAAAVMAPIS